ncbi:TPA: hypothetical protein L4S07_006037 [Pseudomonas aeruginosa]|nr:hypothetical protein [Pseudomonas aeruginosa]
MANIGTFTADKDGFTGKSVMGKAVYFDFRPYSCGFRRFPENLLLKIVYISGFYPAFSWRKYTRNRRRFDPKNSLGFGQVSAERQHCLAVPQGQSAFAEFFRIGVWEGEIRLR